MDHDQPRIVVAPDSFKGTFTADEAAQAMADGVLRAGAVPVLRPLADGGEGLIAVLHAVRGGTLHHRAVQGPLGDLVHAPILLLDGHTAVVETASAAGLTMIAADLRRPEDASTYGVGQLIAAATQLGARQILVGAGGSATTDGGHGALTAIEDAGGLPEGTRIDVLCDVDTPFEQAAIVFGPQKGADGAAVQRLTERLTHQAASYRRNPTAIPRTGCAGGLSGGLWAQHDAQLRSGIAAVLDEMNIDADLRTADAVLTGEGRLDSQSLAGKAIAGLAQRCHRAGVELHAIVGQNAVEASDHTRLGLATVRTASTAEQISAAAAQCVERLRAG